jgi:hypothetical protein
MNDFTKEELRNLYKCVRLTEMQHGECSDLDNLKLKIQSMIDNYCDHEFYEHNRLGSICKKCGDCE